MNPINLSVTVIPGAESPAARWFVRELFRRSWLAHHPTCHCFDRHLLRFGSISLCLGCSCLFSGMLVASVILAWLSWIRFDLLNDLGTWSLVSIGVGLYIPTLAQPFLQRKAFKIVARLFLGVAIPCLWYGAMVLLPWSSSGLRLRIVFMITFWLTYRATQHLRARWTRNPCDSCPHGVFPFCKDNLPKVVSLISVLRSRTSPEEQGFVDFVATLAGLKQGESKIEIISLNNFLQGAQLIYA